MFSPLHAAALGIGAVLLLASRSGSSRYTDFSPGARFPPFSETAYSLFAEAAREVGVPVEWSRAPGLHHILAAESQGYVGVPNYKYVWTGKVEHSDPSTWVPVLRDIQNGGTGFGPLIHTFRCGPRIQDSRLSSNCRESYLCFTTALGPAPGDVTCIATATGLGQLLTRNVERYYPSGRRGVGVPLEEAAGMLAYIEDRYGDPASAWAAYQESGY